MKRHRDNTFLAVAFGLCAFFCFALMNAVAKVLSESHHVIEIAFWRNLLPVLPLMSWLYISGQKNKFILIKPELTVFRAFVGITSLCVMFAAYQNLPMADATTLIIASVLITPALSFFVLAENMGVHRWAAICFGFLGVVIMVGPSGAISFWGTVFALSTAFLHSVLTVILRQIRDQSGITTTFYFMTFGALVLSPFVLFVSRPFSETDIMYMLACSVIGVLGQFCISSAYRFAPTYVIAPLNYTSIVWASIFDIVIWSVIPGWPVFAGAAMIFAANLYILHRERKLNKI